MKIGLDYGHCLSGSDTGAEGNGYCYQNRWLNDNNNWYYFKDNCKMTTNETLTYKFNSNGEWING